MEKAIAILIMVGLSAGFSFGTDRLFRLHADQDVLAEAIEGKIMKTNVAKSGKTMTRAASKTQLAKSGTLEQSGAGTVSKHSIQPSPTPTPTDQPHVNGSADPPSPTPTRAATVPNASITPTPTNVQLDEPVLPTPEPTRKDPPDRPHGRPQPTIEIPPPVLGNTTDEVLGLAL
jgi:hypothetical protein